MLVPKAFPSRAPGRDGGDHHLSPDTQRPSALLFDAQPQNRYNVNVHRGFQACSCWENMP